jgi:S1-C subfamily serine protease
VSLAKTIIITLADGRRFPVKRVGVDNDSDVALLQIPSAPNLTALPFADSSKLQVGDFVAALGSPLGLNQTVTSGIVSALHRSNLGIEGIENFIQTDASINMGNSGGPLINTRGEIVGINTALFSNTGGNIGIGFAIPANMVQNIVQQVLKFGKVRHGLMGVLVQTLSPDLVMAMRLPEGQKGAVIAEIVPYTPAATSGLQIGDIITSINGQKIQSNEDVRNIVGLARTNDKIHLVALREGKPLPFEVVTQSSARNMMQQQMNNPYFFGTELKVASVYRPPLGEIEGIQITKIDPYSAAMVAGLAPGDIIISVNKVPVKTIHDLIAAAKLDPQHGLLLQVIHQKGTDFVVLR